MNLNSRKLEYYIEINLKKWEIKKIKILFK